jgi:hypothetical protein
MDYNGLSFQIYKLLGYAVGLHALALSCGEDDSGGKWTFIFF